MKKNIILIALLSLLSNCVSTKNVPINISDSASIKGKTIVVLHDEKPSFSAMTYGNMMLASFTLGIVGVSSMIHDGNKIVKENEIEDPAMALSDNIAASLKSKYDVKIIDDKTPKEVSGSVSKISDQYRNSADYALDIRTASWILMYVPMKTNHFKILYSSKLKLIDLKISKVVAEGFCFFDSSSNKQDKLPTYDELLSDNAKVLKQKLSSATEFCSNSFKNNAFNIQN